MAITKKHLRLHHSTWVLHRRLPKRVADLWGKTFLVRSLQTSDLAEANRMRDAVWLEVERLDASLADPYSSRKREAQIAQEVRDLQAKAHQAEDRIDTSGDPSDWGPKLVALPEHRALDSLLESLQVQAEQMPDGAKWFKRVTGQSVPISQFVDQFNAETETVMTTKLGRRSSILSFEEWARCDLQAVTKRKAGEYASKLHKDGLAPKSMNSRLSALSTYWKWLVKKGIVEDNVWQHQQVSPRQVIERHHWTLEEVRELIAEAPTRLLADSVTIVALSGLRRGELVALTVADCEGGFFRIHQGKTKAAKRKVPIHSQLATIIARRTVGKKPTDFLLDELDDGRSMKLRADVLTKRFGQYRDQLVGKVKDATQADKVFHSLRATFTHYRLAAGCDLRLVQELVGHIPRGVTLTHYYGGMTDEQARQVVEAVGLFAD